MSGRVNIGKCNNVKTKIAETTNPTYVGSFLIHNSLKEQKFSSSLSALIVGVLCVSLVQ